MKDRNGFTLIELLAVILILGIIVLIAIPGVSAIVKQAKMGAFSASIRNIVKEVSNECALRQIGGFKPGRVYFFSGGEVNPKLDVSGKTPESGFIQTDSYCNVKVDIQDGNFKATKEYEDDTIYVKEGNKIAPLYDSAVEYVEVCNSWPDGMHDQVVNALKSLYPDLSAEAETLSNDTCLGYGLSENRIEYLGEIIYFDIENTSAVDTFSNIFTGESPGTQRILIIDGQTQLGYFGPCDEETVGSCSRDMIDEFMSSGEIPENGIYKRYISYK